MQLKARFIAAAAGALVAFSGPASANCKFSSAGCVPSIGQVLENWRQDRYEEDLRRNERIQQQRAIDAHRREQARKVPPPKIVSPETGSTAPATTASIQLSSNINYKKMLSQADRYVGNVMVMRGRLESIDLPQKNYARLIISITQDPSYARLWSDPILIEIKASENIDFDYDPGAVVQVNGKFQGLGTVTLGDKTMSVPRLEACAGKAEKAPIIPRCD